MSDDPTPPRRPRPSGPVQYKGDDLEAERGPGLGCFRFQLVILVLFIVLTPLSVAWDWPPAVSAGLLFAVILLLLVTGQTIIFLLRLVAADRRGRRRPLGSATPTVGELEDAARDQTEEAPSPPGPVETPSGAGPVEAPSAPAPVETPSGAGPVEAPSAPGPVEAPSAPGPVEAEPAKPDERLEGR